MEKEEIEKLKAILKERKEKIERELREFAKEGKTPGDWETKFPYYDGDSGSSRLEREADEVEEYENLLALEHSLETKLKEIELALKKMEEGNYGICEKCKKEIEIERLKVFPEARFCQKCQK